MHKILSLLTVVSIMMTSCNERTNKIHAIWIDITGSTELSKEENRNMVLGYIKTILNEKVKGGEEVVIYPIHTWTESAGHVVKRIMPIKKSLVYKTELKKLTKEILLEIEEKLFTQSRIKSPVRSSTSLFPIFNKLKWLSKRGKVEVTIFSDMIEDNAILDFTEFFGRLEKPAIKKLALKKYAEIKDEISIAGTSITILYPRTEVGGPNNAILPKVETFWETFIGETGANLFIADL